MSPRPPAGRPISGARRPRPQSAAGSPLGKGASSGAGGGGTSRGARGRDASPEPGGAGGRRVLPAELGLAGRRVLTLPSHVDQCDKGEQCCWRWLAHAVLKEASWLKEDLDTAREEHAQYTRERMKAEHDAEAFAELRGAHAEMQRELADVRSEAHELRRELTALKTAHAHKVAHEQELERELARSDRERKMTAEREGIAMRRAQQGEQESTVAKAMVEDLQKKLLHAEDQRARTKADLDAIKREKDLLQQAVDLHAAKGKKKKGAKGKAAAGPGKAK